MVETPIPLRYHCESVEFFSTSLICRTCVIILRPVSQYTPRYLTFTLPCNHLTLASNITFIRTWRPCNLIVGDLFGSSASFSRIISVFCVERISFSSVHHFSIIPMAVCPAVSICVWLFPDTNIRRSSAYAISRTALPSRVNRSSKTRFQRLGPSISAGIPSWCSSIPLHVCRPGLFVLADNRQREGTDSVDISSLANGAVCSAVVERSLISNRMARTYLLISPPFLL